MSKHKELATDYFERHKLSNECHITSDNRVFHTKGSADGFATALDNQKVSSFTRKEIETKTDLTPEFEEGERALKLEELGATELVVANYQVMKDLVKYFKLEVADQKAPTLITALTDFKLKNQA